MSTPTGAPRGGFLTPAKVEVLYDRSFIMDLKLLPRVQRKAVCQFVFGDFFETKHLQFLPEFRQIGTSKIFYRFSLENHFISIEVTGQIVKFLRILPYPIV